MIPVEKEKEGGNPKWKEIAAEGANSLVDIE